MPLEVNPKSHASTFVSPVCTWGKLGFLGKKFQQHVPVYCQLFGSSNPLCCLSHGIASFLLSFLSPLRLGSIEAAALKAFLSSFLPSPLHRMPKQSCL